MFNLFSDLHIQLNAKFTSPSIEESRSLVIGSTFIEQLGLIVKHCSTHALTKIKISALDYSITTADNFITIGNHPVTVNIINGIVTTTVESVSVTPSHDETAWVRIVTDVGFSLKVKFVKKHLDFVITDTNGLTTKAHGIQGKYALYIFVCGM